MARSNDKSARRRARLAYLALLVGIPGLLVRCHPSPRSTPLEDIPKLQSLEQVMEIQQAVTAPQFRKINQSSYDDAEYAGFAATSTRIQATSLKMKEFTHGPNFDALAMQLHGRAGDLGKAASARDATGASRALAQMKSTCDQCHGKFR